MSYTQAFQTKPKNATRKSTESAFEGQSGRRQSIFERRGTVDEQDQSVVNETLPPGAGYEEYRFKHDFSQVPVSGAVSPLSGRESRETIRAKGISGRVPEVSPGLEKEVNARRSHGSPLPDGVRTFFEPRFGADLGRVRVHADARSSAIPAKINARAFTVGRDIFFAPGHFQLETRSGQKLLAHELAHTIQQNNAAASPSVLQRRSVICPADHPLEREADIAAEQVVDGCTSDRLNVLPASTGESPWILRAIAVPEIESSPPISLQPQGAGAAASVAREVITFLRTDPQDRAGLVQRRLSTLDPLTREIVLGRVRSEMTQEERDNLSGVLERTGPPEPATASEVTAAREAPERRPARAPARERPQQGRPSTEPGEAQAGTRPASQVSSVRAAAASAASVPNVAEETATRLEASQSAAQGRAEATLGQATAEASEQSGEAGNVAQETTSEVVESASEQATEPEAEETSGGGLPSLRSRLEPIEEAPGGMMPEPLPMIAPELPEAVSPLEMGSFEIARPLPVPEAETLGEEYDPEAARAEVAAIIDNLNATSEVAQQGIHTGASEVRSRLTATAESARQAVRTQVAESVASLETEFASRRDTIESGIEQVRSDILGEHDRLIDEAILRGEEGKESLSGLFSQHRTDIEGAVQREIDAAGELTLRHETDVQTRTRSQANEARRRGLAAAASYPRTERGNVQSGAALGVANETAQEIEEREPETVEAIDEVTADIPEEFREKGREALDGYDNGLPDLLARVDEQAESITNNLDNQQEQADQALETARGEALTRLDALESSTITRVEAVGPQAEAQIDAALQNALAPLGWAPARAARQLGQVADEAVQILSEAETPDIQASHEFEAQVVGFLTEASADAVDSMKQGNTQIAAGFQGVERTCAESLKTAEETAAADLQTLEEETIEGLTDFQTTTAENYERAVQALDDSIAEAEAEVGDKLEQAVTDLETELDGPLSEADLKVTEASDEGLAKNDEALVELEGKMEEAADDAAWDYDHPVLAAIRDIGAIVAGIIVGILAVLALVVVVIVGFKLLIAGLVALGISLAVAKIIVLVAGLGLLAYGIYQAYKEEGSLGGALLQLTGLKDIGRAFSEPGLSPFERGFAFGKGVGTLASFFIARGMGKRINARFDARFPRLANPQRGAALRWLRGRTGGKPALSRPDVGLAGRGYRPAPGERAMGREQYRAQARAERVARTGGRPAPPGPEAAGRGGKVIPISRATRPVGEPARLQPGRERPVTSLAEYRAAKAVPPRGPQGPRPPQAARQAIPEPVQEAVGAEGFAPRPVTTPGASVAPGGKGGLRIVASAGGRGGGRLPPTETGGPGVPGRTGGFRGRGGEPSGGERIPRRAPTLREAMEGPRDLEGTLSELERVTEISDPAERTLAARAGTAIERVEVERVGQSLSRSGHEVIPRTSFGRLKATRWLRSVFPGNERPDFVAINRGEGKIVVGDVTARPRVSHIEKTIDYARRLLNNPHVPEEFRNFRVVAREWYWEHGVRKMREIPILH